MGAKCTVLQLLLTLTCTRKQMKHMQSFVYTVHSAKISCLVSPCGLKAVNILWDIDVKYQSYTMSVAQKFGSQNTVQQKFDSVNPQTRNILAMGVVNAQNYLFKNGTRKMHLLTSGKDFVQHNVQYVVRTQTWRYYITWGAESQIQNPYKIHCATEFADINK